MPQIAVVGTWGIHSLGDDAILHVLARGLLNNIEDATLVPFSWMAMAPRVGDAGDAQIRRVNDYLENCATIMGRATASAERTLEVKLRGLWDIFERADLVVLGGGNLLTDVNPCIFDSPMQRYAFLFAITRALKIPVVALGQSIGPIETEWGREIARYVFEGCEAITVRDRYALEFIRALGLEAELLPDLAMGLSLMDAHDMPRGDFIAVSPKITDEHCDWMYPLAEALNVVKREVGLTTLVVPHCRMKRFEHDDDTNACLALGGMVDGARLLTGEVMENPLSALAMYARCSAAITIRMHGAVFSTIAGVPFVAMNYWPKVEGFCEQVGVPALPMDASAEQILEAFWPIWERREEESRRLRSIADEMNGRVARHFDIVQDVLGRA